MRLLLFQNVIPSYRVAVFRELREQRDIDVEIVGGTQSPAALKLAGDADFKAYGFAKTDTRYFSIRGENAFSYQPKALSIARRTRPDAIIVQGGPYELTSWLLLLWGRLTGVPVLAWTIGLQTGERGLKWKIRKLFFSLARGLLLYGDYPARLLAERGIPRSRMFVVYNSLDLSQARAQMAARDPDDARSLRAELGIGPDAVCFIFIGRLVRRKRLGVAIEAVSRLANRGEDVHFLLIGDGEDRARLEKLARAANASERIHFTGSLYDEADIARHMALATGAIIPEAGLPIIHPMAYGAVPVISDEIGRHGTEWEAVIDGETGFFFKDDDPDSLAERLAYMIEHPAEMRAIGEAASALAVERYGSQAHAARILEAVRKYAAE